MAANEPEPRYMYEFSHNTVNGRALIRMVTHGDIRECISAAMGMHRVEVWPSGVHTPNNKSSSNVTVIPSHGKKGITSP